MVSDNLAGHTAAQNTLGEDGLRDGDALSPATLTNLLQGVHGNGIIRYQDGAYDSTRNETNSGNQPGSIVRASSSTLTVSGGFAVLDGALYEFGNGVGNTKTLDLNDATHGTGGLVLSSNEEAIYTVYVAPSGGHFKIHYEGGSPVDTTTGLYPSASNQYLIDFDTGATQDNMKAVVLAHVRVQYVASGGGTRNINIVEINDKRVFIKAAADFRVPLSLGSISSGEIVDTGDKGVNRVEHLNVVHNENGELTVSDTVNVHWVSHPRYGSFSQSPPSSSDAGYGQGPSRGADRGGGHAADSFYFAGRNNEQTGHYSVRLQGMGVDATSTGLTTNGTWVVTADGDAFFMLSPNSGVTITLNPERDGSANYMFPEGHIIEVCNDGDGSIVFDNQTSPTGLNATLSSGHRATFIYEGSVWVRCDYQSAIIGLPDPAIEINSGAPVFATGITKAEVQTLLNVADGATANAGTVTSIATTAPITGGTITSTGTIGISAATTSAAGSMSGADKTKLDGIEASADVTDATNVASAISGASLTGVTVATDDKVLIQDTSDSNNLKTVTTQAIADLFAPADPLYFTAKVGSNTNDSGLTAGTWHKVEYWDIINNETLTLDSATDGEKFTVGSGQGGLYSIHAQVGWVATNSTLPSSGTSPYQLHVAIYVNGSVVVRQGTATYGSPSAKTAPVSTEIVLADSDYVEIYFFVRKEDDTGNTGTQQLRGGEYCRWSVRRIGDS